MDQLDKQGVCGCGAHSRQDPQHSRTMPQPYSVDLRQRVLAAVESRKYTHPEIAALFQVGTATISTWIRRNKAGELAPKPHSGGPERTISEAGQQIVWALHAEQNDRTLQEYVDAYEQKTGVRVSVPTMCRALQSLGLSRKKSR